MLLVGRTMSRARGHQLLGPISGIARNLDTARTAPQSGRVRSGGGADEDRARGFDERPHARTKIVLFDVERGNEPHDLIVEAAGDEQHISLEPRAGPSHTRLHLVEYKERTDLRRELAKPAQE